MGEANAKLERCVSRVRISAAGFGTRDTCAVGGIAGKLSGAMTDCRFEGSIDITCKRGGAYISGGVGGLAGNAAGGALTRCVNTGAVTVDKGTGVGGIAGITSREVTFTQCANTGHISNDTTAVLSSGEKPKGGTGGILGVGKSGNVSISLCYNTGTVSGTTIVGGILGGEAGDYGTSISNGNPSLTVETAITRDFSTWAAEPTASALWWASPLPDSTVTVFTSSAAAPVRRRAGSALRASASPFWTH